MVNNFLVKLNVCYLKNIAMVKTSFFIVFSSPVYGVLAVNTPLVLRGTN
jgi:hypothetical protein